MSYTFTAPDPLKKGDVDFDFFDDPEDRASPTLMGRSGNWKQESEKNVKDKEKKDSVQSSKARKSPVMSETDSYSSDYSDDDSDIDESSNRKEVKKIEAKIPTAISPKATKENKRRSRMSSSGDDIKHDARPKTSLERPRHRSYSSGSDHSSLSDSDYTTDTDSDVTDVSPLNTPHTPDSKRPSSQRHSSRPPKSPGHKEVTFRRPDSGKSSASSSYRPLTRADDDNIDLRILMQAVMEMERGNNMPPSGQRSMHTTNVQTPMNQGRKNMSFNNDGVRTIDLENQRLMKRIMQCTQEAKQRKKQIKATAKKTSPGSNKVSTSTINRRNAQKKIEQENFAMLQRLQKARPTKGLAKESLVSEYNSQYVHGCQVAAAHPLPKRQTLRSPSPYVVPFDPKFTPTKSSSVSNLRGDEDMYAAHSNTRRQRPVSATVRGTRPPSASTSARQRPQSAKVHGSGQMAVKPASGKPAWDERW